MIISSKEKKNNQGFTLVEMIVVLIVLGILASAAVYGIAAYINLTRYNNNQQNAESVYQAAQATLNHMSENGTIDEWALELIGEKGASGSDNAEDRGIGTEDGYNDNNPEDTGYAGNIYNQTYFETLQSLETKNPGLSAHMRYSLTYLPEESFTLSEEDRAQNDLILQLIRDEFKSTDIFSGIITIEFDVEKVLDTSLSSHYSVSVYSVFYDSRISSWNAGLGSWSQTALNSAAGNDSRVPYRLESYRSGTSLVGYYVGSYGLSEVDSVYLPPETKIDNFTLRNGETLDLSWSLSSEDGSPITGIPSHIHYTFSLYNAEDDRKFCDLAINENSILDTSGIPRKELYSTAVENNGTYTYPESIYNIFKDRFDSRPFANNYVEQINFRNHSGSSPYTVVYTREEVHDEYNTSIVIYRASFKTTTKVFVHLATDSSYAFEYNDQAVNLFDANDSGYYTFPLTVSYEVYEISGTPLPGRVTYTLTLDAMMARNILDLVDDDRVLNTDSNQTPISVRERVLNYSFNRILNGSATHMTYAIPPVNFYAKMSVGNDDFGTYRPDYNENYLGNTISDTDATEAGRALNDPVYLCPDGTYKYIKNAAHRDQPNRAVVNAFFGDLGTGSVLNKPDSNVAVITSFRHLYNIRMLADYSNNVTYYIDRDLNWFNVNSDNTYSSDVIVYGAGGTEGLKVFSPVPVIDPTPGNPYPIYGKDLNVVSFPSIVSLNNHSTLIARSNSFASVTTPDPTVDSTSVINNVQMRNAAFYSKDDAYDIYHAYGLIGTNYGKIVNIRLNALTLVLCDTPDGHSDDREDIINGIHELVTGSVEKDTTEADFEGTAAVGGLVGANGGTIGDQTITRNFENTVRASNCIVTALHQSGGTWKVYDVSSIACLIGDNGTSVNPVKEGQVYGTLEACGHFAVAGWIDAAGIIGYSKSNIDAKLRVNNAVNDSDPYKPLIDFGKVTIASNEVQINSVIYATGEAAGGAVAKLDKGMHICQSTGLSPLQSGSAADGRFNITERPGNAEYAVDVQLDSGSFIMFKTNVQPKNNDHGGVGGAIGRMNCSGRISIRVMNSGWITASEGRSYEQNVGGAVGTIHNSVLSDVSIFVINDGNIGTFDGTSPYGRSNSTGGAIGRIRLSSANAGSSFTVSVTNNGAIMGDFSHLGNNAGVGVGGSIGSIASPSYDSFQNLSIKCDNFGIIKGTALSLAGDSGSNAFGVGGVIGYTQFIPYNSAFYGITEDNASVSSDGNNAGGVIGSHTNAAGTLPGSENTTITSDLHNGSSISASASNAGGAIGNTSIFHLNILVRTKITGTVEINALSNSGGVCGRLNTNTTTINSSVILEGDASDKNSILKICASGTNTSSYKNNAGGLIGACTISSGSSAFQPVLSMPSQSVTGSGGNILCVNVDSYNDNAGGMIGYFKDTFSNINSDFAIMLHPASHVYARHNNAGGCIGKLDFNKILNSNLEVRDSSISSSSVPYIWADGENAGGVIGYSGSAMTLSASNTVTLNSTKGIKIKSGILDTETGTVTGGNAGGCFGLLEGSATINGEISISGNKIEIAGFANTGGVIGKCKSVTINGTLSNAAADCSLNGPNGTGGVVGACNTLTMNGTLSNTADLCAITGTASTGGVIGDCTNSTLFGIITIGKYTVDSITGAVTIDPVSISVLGTNDTGGVIGLCKGTSISGTITYGAGRNEIDAAVFGNDRTGGCIGQLSGGSISETALIEFAGEYTEIKGNTTTGGCIGYVIDSNSISGNISFSGSNNKITGSSDNTGGVIGSYRNSTIKDSASVTFSGNNTPISGVNNTGGLIGGTNGGKFINNSSFVFDATDSFVSGNDYVGGIVGKLTGTGMEASGGSGVSISYSGTRSETATDGDYSITGNNNVGGVFGGMTASAYSKEGARYTFSGVNSLIKGNDNVGGVIGSSVNSSNLGPILFSPVTSCTIIGENNVAGCVGLGNGNKGGQRDNANLPNNPSISLNNCAVTISATGYAGGIVGQLQSGCWFSGSTITISGDKTLTIRSSDQSAGGHIGYMNGVNMGNVNNHLVTTCNDSSAIIISGKIAAGGVIGYIKNEAKTNRPTIYFTLNDSSSITVSAAGGEGAGGIIGVNGSEFGHSADVNWSGSGTITVNGPAGYTGAYIGKNLRSFKGAAAAAYSGFMSHVMFGGNPADKVVGNGTY